MARPGDSSLTQQKPPRRLQSRSRSESEATGGCVPPRVYPAALVEERPQAWHSSCSYAR
jgi:hypothetical protein